MQLELPGGNGGGKMLAQFAIALSLLFPSFAAQSASSSTESTQSPTKRPHVDQSVVVGAHLTPEEAEDGRINDIYQPMYKLLQSGDCNGIVKTAQSIVIPAAEQAKFETVRKKFSFSVTGRLEIVLLKRRNSSKQNKRTSKL